MLSSQDFCDEQKEVARWRRQKRRAGTPRKSRLFPKNKEQNTQKHTLTGARASIHADKKIPPREGPEWAECPTPNW